MSREIAEDLADRLGRMRQANLSRYDIQLKNYKKLPGGPTNPEMVVVGGYVRSYQFTYEEGKDIAQGSMQIMFDENRFCECDVTVVILKDSEVNAGETGERIVHNTRKLSDFNESVLEAYFSAYCNNISKWIVVYKKFESYLDDENQNAFPRLCEPDGIALADFWRQKLRSLVTVLAASETKGVVHGGLSLATGYAISAGTIKLINVARRLKLGGTDLGDLREFLLSNAYLQATSYPDWRGFDFLLGSNKMNQKGWDTVVLGHPVLLKASGKVIVYDGVEIFMWGLTEWQRGKFAEALSTAMPEHKEKHIFSFFPNDRAARELIRKSKPYSDTYLATIQTVRNLNRHEENWWDALRKCWTIHMRFRGYISMAYSVSKLRQDEWVEMTSVSYTRKLKSRAQSFH